MSVQVLLREGGRLNDCIGNKSIIKVLVRESEIKTLVMFCLVLLGVL